MANHKYAYKPAVKRVAPSKAPNVVRKKVATPLKPVKASAVHAPVSVVQQKNVQTRRQRAITKRQRVIKTPPVRKTRRVDMVRKSGANARTSRRRPDPEKIMAIKNIGKGKSLVILACGPSINELELEKLKDVNGIDIMCINKPNTKVWPSAYWAFCDHSQYKRNSKSWNNYKGQIINSTSVRQPHPRQVAIRNKSGHGWSLDITDGYHIGRSSTYANMQVALWMNYDKIYVFGLDMGSVDGKMHCYGNNPDVDDKVRAERFKKEAEFYVEGAKILTEEQRQKFILCSNYNKFEFTKQFGSLDHTIAIDHILKETENGRQKASQ